MSEPEPLFRVVSGHPTDEEVAALTLALSALLSRAAAGSRVAADRVAVGGWADRSQMLRAPLAHGPGAWRRSGRPR